MLNKLYSSIEKSFDEMVSIRRDFHMNPELSFHEVETPNKIAHYHRNLGLDVKEKVGGRGVVATLVGGKPGKTVALRADFDALPIQDEKDVPYKSKVDGVMHACGHDAHTATLLVLAKILTSMKEEIEGNIVFIHQFAEEVTPGGAKPMIEDGCLDGVDAIFGTHLWSNFPVGEIRWREGYIMAAADRFEIKVNGKGGHGASPHETIDPIVIGGQLINSIQSLVSRQVDPLESAVVTIGSFHSGNAFNVIPDKAFLAGTVRTFNDDVRSHLEVALQNMVTRTCEASGATSSYTYDRGYPAVWNHPNETRLLVDSAQHIEEVTKIAEMNPVMGGEDFSYYVQKVPGTFFFTGAGNQEKGANFPHHHPKFDIDERSMVIAAKTLGSAALMYLNGEVVGNEVSSSGSVVKP